ncbi:17436_t:CDS:2, partial [Entrophospora sp. SA101]
CKEDRVTVLKFAVEGVSKNQGHQDLFTNFDLYIINPVESTAEAPFA